MEPDLLFEADLKIRESATHSCLGREVHLNQVSDITGYDLKNSGCSVQTQKMWRYNWLRLEELGLLCADAEDVEME
jgi:hypothetical protein